MLSVSLNLDLIYCCMRVCMVPFRCGTWCFILLAMQDWPQYWQPLATPSCTRCVQDTCPASCEHDERLMLEAKGLHNNTE